MEIIPSQSDVIEILTRTGALREGHFELPGGRHCDRYLQMPLAMRYYQEAKTLSVALSRRLRSDVALPSTRAMPGLWPNSAPVWMASPWRSNWPLPGCARCRWTRSTRGWINGFGC